jgi:hypothetical protein
MSAVRLAGVLASGAFALLGTSADTALDLLIPAGWTEVGHVVLDKSGCADCPATFSDESRPISFALTSDSPFPIDLAGRFDVHCADGSTYDEFLNSPRRRGIFQRVPNLCINYDSTSVTVSMTTVSLSPPDENRLVMLTVYGTN